MIVKVCGMIEADNVRKLIPSKVDWVGFIFYPSSKRYVEADPQKIEYLKTVSGPTRGLERVGVFVNASKEEILEKVNQYHLTVVQLHGEETALFCGELKKEGLVVVKAFGVDQDFDFRAIVHYEFECDYLLFDTKGPKRGGNGFTFDWSILKKYSGQAPFILSGGIDADSVESLQNFSHPKFAGIDLNSGFEISPGLKDVDKINTFLGDLSRKVFRSPDFWNKKS